MINTLITISAALFAIAIVACMLALPLMEIVDSLHNRKRNALPLAHTIEVPQETIEAWIAYWEPAACQARTLEACDRLYPIAIDRLNARKADLEAYHASLFRELNNKPAQRDVDTAICACPILD